MTQKRFTVRRIGSEYQVEPDQFSSLEVEDILTAGLGALLAGYGVSRRDMSGALLVGAGAALVWHGLKGRKPLSKGFCKARDLVSGETQGVSYPGESERIHQSPQDLVDEESMESFPASDAPAR